MVEGALGPIEIDEVPHLPDLEEIALEGAEGEDVVLQKDPVVIVEDDVPDFVIEGEIGLVRPEVRDDHDGRAPPVAVGENVGVVVVDDLELPVVDDVVVDGVFPERDGVLEVIEDRIGIFHLLLDVHPFFVVVVDLDLGGDLREAGVARLVPLHRGPGVDPVGPPPEAEDRLLVPPFGPHALQGIDVGLVVQEVIDLVVSDVAHPDLVALVDEGRAVEEEKGRHEHLGAFGAVLDRAVLAEDPRVVVVAPVKREVAGRGVLVPPHEVVLEGDDVGLDLVVLLVDRAVGPVVPDGVEIEDEVDRPPAALGEKAGLLGLDAAPDFPDEEGVLVHALLAEFLEVAKKFRAVGELARVEDVAFFPGLEGAVLEGRVLGKVGDGIHPKAVDPEVDVMAGDLIVTFP